MRALQRSRRTAVGGDGYRIIKQESDGDKPQVKHPVGRPRRRWFSNVDLINIKITEV